MWECPITTYMSEIINQQMVERENAITLKVSETIGVEVNREELIKALNYDRQQYEKGYADAKAEYAPKWTKISEPPQKADFYHVVMKSKDPLYEYRYETGYYDTYYKCWYVGKITYSQNMVIAWMPIPKYEGAET